MWAISIDLDEVRGCGAGDGGGDVVIAFLRRTGRGSKAAHFALHALEVGSSSPSGPVHQIVSMGSSDSACMCVVSDPNARRVHVTSSQVDHGEVLVILGACDARGFAEQGGYVSLSVLDGSLRNQDVAEAVRKLGEMILSSLSSREAWLGRGWADGLISRRNEHALSLGPRAVRNCSDESGMKLNFYIPPISIPNPPRCSDGRVGRRDIPDPLRPDGDDGAKDQKPKDESGEPNPGGGGGGGGGGDDDNKEKIPTEGGLGFSASTRALVDFALSGGRLSGHSPGTLAFNLFSDLVTNEQYLVRPTGLQLGQTEVR